MIRTRRSLLPLLLILLALPWIVSAQVKTGTPPFGSFAGGPDVINLANLNDHWTIPILHKNGRGLPFDFYLTFDSSVWAPVTSGSTVSWQPLPNFGLGGSANFIGGVIALQSTTSGICGVFPSGGFTTTTTYTWTYQDGLGTQHPFSQTSTVKTNSCTGNTQTGFSGAAASDGSGYVLSVTGSTVTKLLSSDGNVINAPTIPTATGRVDTTNSTGNVQDRNGNQVSLNRGVFTDTLGTTALTATGSDLPPSSAHKIIRGPQCLN